MPDEPAILARCAELKTSSKKAIWPRVYLNRLIGFLPTASRRAGCKTPEYFDRVRGFDLWNAAGARADFISLWRLSLRAAKALGAPGIVADFECYNCGGLANPTTLASATGRQLPEVLAALRALGGELADVVAEEYPEAVIWSLFTGFGRPDWFKAGNMPLPALHAFIFEGMLDRARARRAGFRLVAGGEDDLGYYNPSLGVLKQKIAGRATAYDAWLRRFGRWLALGGTVTVWNDESRLTDWVRKDAGDSPPFKRFDDFVPIIAELLASYRFVWLYVPMCTDYNPFDGTSAAKLNPELRKTLEAGRSPKTANRIRD